MRLLYWNTPVYGRLMGTIQCLDGHVILSEIPADDRDAVEAMIREFADSCEWLPPLRSVVGAMLVGHGWERDPTHAPHLFFRPGRPKVVANDVEAEAPKKATPRKRAKPRA